MVGFSWSFRLYKNKFFDSGWGFGRLIMWLMLGMPIWFLAHMGLPANQSLFFYLLFFGLSINAALYFERQKKIIIEFLKKRWKLIVVEELIFLLFFLFLCLVRGNQPRVEGLEKFMDVGFIAGYLRSPTLPAEDMWLAGEKINYYTFGHFLGSVATHFLGVEVEISYNLLLGMIMGLVAIQAASFSVNLVHNPQNFFSRKNINGINLLVLLRAAVVGGFLLVLAGNGHTSWYFISKGSFSGYWYPDATRFIERTIHEFPAYSFIVSDLHAHVWSMPLVIFIMLNIYLWVDSLRSCSGWSFQLTKIFRRKNKKFNLIELLDTKATDCIKALIITFKKIVRHFFSSNLYHEAYFHFSLLVGALLGVAISTSTWDFLVYSLLLSILGLILLISDKKLFWKIIISAFVIFLTAILVASAWLLNFVSISEGVAIAKEHSPFWQLLVLWLPHLVLSVLTMILSIQLIKKRHKLDSREVMIIGMMVTSVILLILPEFIYMKDIYPNHPRANTMFKLTFQAFVMMTLVISTLFGIIGTKEFKKQFGSGQQLVTKVLILLFILSNGYYAFFGYRDFYGGLKKYQSLDGLSWLELSSPNDYEAITWLRRNVDGRPVILEAVGESYTTYARVSTFTGLPTVLGWRVHEWLWRGGFDIPGQRTTEVKTIYTDPSSQESKDLINKYNVQYIFIGVKEKEAYEDINEFELLQLGKIVFSSGDTKIIQID